MSSEAIIEVEAYMQNQDFGIVNRMRSLISLRTWDKAWDPASRTKHVYNWVYKRGSGTAAT